MIQNLSFISNDLAEFLYVPKCIPVNKEYAIERVANYIHQRDLAPYGIIFPDQELAKILPPVVDPRIKTYRLSQLKNYLDSHFNDLSLDRRYSM